MRSPVAPTIGHVRHVLGIVGARTRGAAVAVVDPVRGHALDDFSLSDPLVWVAVAALAALAASTLLVLRRLRTSAPG